uniref:Myoneurin n=1 Tax=Rousettus aegyptiacus TaxID=9407 RepID=A0A7J8HSG8_ROUAE|nr:myoneurin [Rousettus aegyptiacus]
MFVGILEKSLMCVILAERHLLSLVLLSLILENTQEKDHLSANYVEILTQILKI